jgi:hypothetical protein
MKPRPHVGGGKRASAVYSTKKFAYMPENM